MLRLSRLLKLFWYWRCAWSRWYRGTLLSMNWRCYPTLRGWYYYSKTLTSSMLLLRTSRVPSVAVGLTVGELEIFGGNGMIRLTIRTGKLHPILAVNLNDLERIFGWNARLRSEEHTSELQSQMRISY